MSLTKLSLGGNNDVIYKLFPPRKRLVSDIPAGDGNIEKLFLQCTYYPAHEKKSGRLENGHEFCIGTLYTLRRRDLKLFYTIISEEVAMIMASGKGDSKCNDCQEGGFKSMPEGRLQL
jgi:hypothetical protein